MQTSNSFFAKLASAVERNDSLLCVGLDPQPRLLPDRYRSADIAASLLTWNRAIIEATAEIACVYKPNIAFYEALGREGYTLLQQTLASIPAHIPVLLDAKRGDIDSTAEAYAIACFDVLGVDAVTVNPYLGRDSLEPFIRHKDRGIFVLCHTSNPGSTEFQELEIQDWRTLDREPQRPLYVHVARAASRWGENVGLVVGATFPDALAQVRHAAPDLWVLVPGVGTQGGALEATVEAGLRADGAGIFINASRSIAVADDPGAEARKVSERINRARSGSTVLSTPAIPITTEGASKPTANLATLPAELLNLGAVKFGEFTLASGQKSPYYVDLRLLVSKPSVLDLVASAYAEIVRGLQADRVAGVPYGALPIATAIAIQTDVPLIYTRKEAKTHGLGKQIEGNWQPGERVVIIEDLISTGGSILQTLEQLRAAGLVVEDAVVLIDREQGGPANLAAMDVRLHSVFTISEIVASLEASGALEPMQAQQVRDYLREKATA